MEQDLDYRALFAATPSPCLVLRPDLTIVDVNQAYLDATGRERADLIGNHIRTVFPDDPADPCADGTRTMIASVRRALSTGRRETLAVQRFNLAVPGRPGVIEERYWSLVNIPVLNGDGAVELLLHRAEDVTAFVRERERHRGRGRPAGLDRGREMEAEIYARARELQELNDRLRRAHARERAVALALQQAMLPEADPARYPDTAVRYLPAEGSLNVCGDWYDLVDLGEDRIAVAVGDVVGHGLPAAGVMGRLSSALSAAICAVEEPARALDILGRYIPCVDGALATTVVQTVIDREARRIAYSSAGHLPPLLVRRDRTVELLDQATDPPLGTRSRRLPRPQATCDYETGGILALYTDGLVEHPGEDIDIGLRRLAGSLGRHVTLAPDLLADAVLADLEVTGGAADDIAFVVIRL